MKSHTIAENVILPACQQIVRIMFGEEALSKLSEIPLSDNTISRRIHDMSENIECNTKSKILKHSCLHFKLMKVQTSLVKHSSLCLFVLLMMILL